MSIIEIAEAKAREGNLRSILCVRLRGGVFSDVACEALEFAFGVARKGTMADTAKLEIENIALVVNCVSCGVVSNPVRAFCLICPRCGLPLQIIEGKEMQIDYIEVE